MTRPFLQLRAEKIISDNRFSTFLCNICSVMPWPPYVNVMPEHHFTVTCHGCNMALVFKDRTIHLARNTGKYTFYRSSSSLSLFHSAARSGPHHQMICPAALQLQQQSHVVTGNHNSTYTSGFTWFYCFRPPVLRTIMPTRLQNANLLILSGSGALEFHNNILKAIARTLKAWPAEPCFHPLQS